MAEFVFKALSVLIILSLNFTNDALADKPTVVCPNGNSSVEAPAKTTLLSINADKLKKGPKASAFGGKYRKSIRCALGDFNNDNSEDIVMGTGPGAVTSVTVLDGKNRKQFSGDIGKFNAFTPTFKGGVYVATGDVNNDGVPDIIAGAGAASPTINIFDGENAEKLLSFLAYESSFIGGVRVAAGDVNGDGNIEVIAAPANSAITPMVKVFDGTTSNLISSFLAYDTSFAGGIYVSAGDVNGDGTAEIITGAGAGGGPHVKIFSGSTGQLLNSFFAFEVNFKGGVSVAASDLDGDGKAEIVTGAAKGGKSEVKVFDGSSLEEIDSISPYPRTYKGGVYVGSIEQATPGPTATPTESLPSGAVSFIDALVFKDINDFTLTPVTDNCGLTAPLVGVLSGNEIVFNSFPGNGTVRFNKQSAGVYTGSSIIILGQPAHNGTVNANGCDITFSFVNTNSNGQCQSKFHFTPPAALSGLLGSDDFATCP